MILKESLNVKLTTNAGQKQVLRCEAIKCKLTRFKTAMSDH